MENPDLTRNSNTCIILSVAGGALKDIVVIASKLGPGSNSETHLRGVLLQWGIIIFLKVLKVRILREHTETWFS